MNISVVMPAYNGAVYIQEQIKSILVQLGENDELIVSLDPSSDETEKIILGMDDARIRLVAGPGCGLLANVEYGLSLAKHELIFLSDQDDVWTSDKVSCVKQVFLNTDCDLVLHDARIVDGDLNEIEPSFFAWRKVKRGFWANVKKNSYIGCCMAFKKSILEYVLPIPTKVPMHDQWIGLMVEKKGRVEFLNQPLLLYRRHGLNQTSSHHAGLFKMLVWRLRLILALWRRL